MRIYGCCRDLMSETGRELNSYGMIVKPKTYQNKVIEGNLEMITKELICQQYCLTKMPDPEFLFAYTDTKQWADEEFKERVSGSIINPGEAWKINPDMWMEFLVEHQGEKRFDYTYAERINDLVRYKGINQTKLEAIINLLKDDNDTRKAVLAIYGASKYNDEFDADHYDGDWRIPCSMYYDFLIRYNGKGEKQLNICYHQRSSDFIGHFGDDVYLAFRLMEYVANKIGIQAGYLYHTIDSIHCYRRDWDKLNSNIDDILERKL